LALGFYWWYSCTRSISSSSSSWPSNCSS